MLSIRDVREWIDGRCSDAGTLVPPYDAQKPACTDAGGDPPPRCQIIEGGTGVQLYPHVHRTPQRQGRFKAAYVISWREIDRFDEAWVNDGLPAGATPAADGDSWEWIDADPGPYVGQRAHRSALVAGVHQHYFSGASQKPRQATPCSRWSPSTRPPRLYR